jgi:hypothetical protein
MSTPCPFRGQSLSVSDLYNKAPIPAAVVTPVAVPVETQPVEAIIAQTPVVETITETPVAENITEVPVAENAELPTTASSLYSSSRGASMGGKCSIL